MTTAAQEHHEPCSTGLAQPAQRSVNARDEPGAVTGRPRTWLKAEAAALAAAGATLFASTHQPWWLVSALFLVPDLGALGLLASTRTGALTYNLTHSTVLPLAFLGLAAGSSDDLLQGVTAIWLLHIGVDRLVGYGLKHDDDPAHTHLGRRGHLRTPAGTGRAVEPR